MTGGGLRSGWIATAIAVAVLIVVIAIVVSLWSQGGDSDITPAGWFAMALGVLLTLALGIGLMTLVFISNRRGYDDQSGTPP